MEKKAKTRPIKNTETMKHVTLKQLTLDGVRDKRNNEILKQNNFKVFRFWESDIKNNINACESQIRNICVLQR